MTASIDAAPRSAFPPIIRRYYLAMGVPFMIDVITNVAYAVIYRAPQVLPPLLLLSVCFFPMITLRLASRRLGIHFGAVIEDPTLLDLITSFVVITGYNVLLT